MKGLIFPAARIYMQDQVADYPASESIRKKDTCNQ